MRKWLALLGILAVAIAGCGDSETKTVTAGAAPPEVPSVEGTTWSGTDSEGDHYVFRFKPGGRLAYTSPSGSFDEEGDTWEQSGASITLKINDGYSTYRGTISGDTMSGSASNVNDHRWEWSVTRQ